MIRLCSHATEWWYVTSEWLENDHPRSAGNQQGVRSNSGSWEILVQGRGGESSNHNHNDDDGIKMVHTIEIKCAYRNQVYVVCVNTCVCVPASVSYQWTSRRPCTYPQHRGTAFIVAMEMANDIISSLLLLLYCLSDWSVQLHHVCRHTTTQTTSVSDDMVFFVYLLLDVGLALYHCSQNTNTISYHMLSCSKFADINLFLLLSNTYSDIKISSDLVKIRHAQRLMMMMEVGVSTRCKICKFSPC